VALRADQAADGADHSGGGLRDRVDAVALTQQVDGGLADQVWP